MKKVILALAVVVGMSFTACNETKKEAKEATTAEVAVNESTDQEMAMATFGVRGNCGMCKKTIETAATGVEGVSKANWDKDKKKIEVSYDDTKTDVASIEKAVAASGYDTENFKGSDTSYENLPACCQYDHSMEMSQE
ncbi:Copper chaperone CopZ [Pustulibacterium marinum]|uniref:Copper chaperone CopZ n=1 Tax=Pustulibacterium marinum TaxID=1224947 RepID=A0A1I7H0S2_9FLAO|nr:cation transporter [Pustulibacterium marinum]SFU54242.1 Copper chaperone CopZ [Pustulibacterium marinum]